MSRTVHTTKLLEMVRYSQGPSNYSSLKHRIGNLQSKLLGSGQVINELQKIEQDVNRKDQRNNPQKVLKTNSSYNQIKTKPYIKPLILSEFSHHHVFSTRSGRLICQKEKSALRCYEDRSQSPGLSKSMHVLRRPMRRPFNIARLYPTPKAKRETGAVKRLTMRYKQLFEEIN